MVAANCWRYSSNKTIVYSFQNLYKLLVLLILLHGKYGFVSIQPYILKLVSRIEFLLLRLRIILVGAILPAFSIEVPRLSRRGRALRGSRWSRSVPKMLYAFAALAEAALCFNGICRRRFMLSRRLPKLLCVFRALTTHCKLPYMRSGASSPTRNRPTLMAVRAASVSARRAFLTAGSSSIMRLS